MTNPTYPISISYINQHLVSQQNIRVAGVTQSYPVYNGDYFLAYMQYANISATGSTYRTALDNLMILATASTTNSNLIAQNRDIF